MKITDSNRYFLPNTNGRFVHLATVQNSIKEYICFFDLQDRRCYIEDITTGNLEFIQDDELAKELSEFLFDNHITDIKYGLPVPD